jgi:prevent-host-death family protein
MDEISIEDARPKLGDLVDHARIAGQSTVITRYGKPAAVLTPVPAASETETDAQQRLAEIRAILAAFDWEHDDRQYALERIEMIADDGQ